MSGRLEGRLIGLGVSGSIAAYKSVELLRRLTAEGADVTVMLTPSATRFVGPLTFRALSRHPVEVDVLDLLPDGRIGHIVLAESADAIVVAPATAGWLGAMANGLAGDAITATCLASTAPLIVAPAMDGDMWTHPATRANVARLRDDFGALVVEPVAGPLASGRSGVGRLAELDDIVEAVVAAVAGLPIRAPDPAVRPPRSEAAPRDADLAGRHVVVSAGGTREPIDPVRFIGNRSTGRMGLAVVAAALDRGARVTLLAANVELPIPDDPALTVLDTPTSTDLGAILDGVASSGFDALVMAAAVADFRPAVRHDRKLERGGPLSLELEPTPDLLAGLTAALADRRPRPVVVGFAAETGSLDRAAGKLRRKGVDLLIANDVSEPGSGFGTETNRVTILAADGWTEALPLQSKRAVADAILDRVVERLDGRAADPAD